MKKHFTVFALIFVTALATANAQLFQMGLKFQYATESIQELQAVGTQVYETQKFTTDLFRKGNLGLMARFNAGRWVSVQAEANFSVSAVWDSVDAQPDIIGAAAYVFQNTKDITLAVPILVQAHLLKLDGFLDLRLYGGPEFYTTIKGASEGRFDFSNYSLVFGAGIDLLNVIYVDGRMTKMMGGEGTFYSVGVGLMF